MDTDAEGTEALIASMQDRIDQLEAELARHPPVKKIKCLCATDRANKNNKCSRCKAICCEKCGYVTSDDRLCYREALHGIWMYVRDFGKPRVFRSRAEADRFYEEEGAPMESWWKCRYGTYEFNFGHGRERLLPLDQFWYTDENKNENVSE